MKKFGSTTYSYNAQGVRYQKNVNGTVTEYVYDGGKLISEGGGRVYFYDMEGVIGYGSSSQTYTYVKDAFGSVIAILFDDKEVARYSYDAWGKCTILKDEYGIASSNPIRWKSLYYDVESGLYYIDGRYYSPETRQFLSPLPAETMFSNALTVFGLNPYLVTLDNCVNWLYNGYTIHPRVELAYDAPEMTGWTWFWSVAWPRFWNSDVGKGLAVGIFIATTLFTMACCLIYPPAILTYTMAYVAGAAGFLVGAAICGFQSMSTGGDFWEGFADYVTNNWSQSLAITSLTCIVSVGFQTAAYLNVSRKVALENAINSSQEAAMARARYLRSRPGKKPTMTSAVVDVKNGAIYYGDSGIISNNINSALVRQMPSINQTGWPIANCAEFNAVNNALNAGARMKDLIVTTVRVRSLTFAPMCANCQVSLSGVLFVVSG